MMMIRWLLVEKYVIWLLLLVAPFPVHQFGQVECCLKEERLALIELDAYMNSYNSNPDYSTNSWSNPEEINCCKWYEVQCNVSSGRVTKLILNSKVVRDDEDAIKNPWLFNMTLFRPFSQLISLDLSSNKINGLVEDHGSTKISSLKNLRVLKLDYNNLESGHISVSNLMSLRTLSLSNASLNESSFLLYQELPNLRKLEVLDLGHNYFSGDIQGTWLCRLRNLQYLDLSGNKFKGGIPSCINNLTSLQILALNDNNFEGKFSIQYLANHSKLQILWLSGNKLKVQTEDALWTPTFQLQYLGLSDCRLNEPLGTLPKFLSYQYNLSAIDLSNNKLVGAFPTWLLTNNSHLQSFYLDNNFFTGNFQLPHHTKPLHEMTELSILNNKVCGELPKTIGFVLPNLELLYLAKNSFEGQIPSSISHMTNLLVLDMSHNNFSGELPSQLLGKSSLGSLDLSYNSLQGDVIPDHMNLPSLYSLLLNNNKFGGKFKDALFNSRSLELFDISNNRVSGRLPNWIGNFSALTILSVSNNVLQGHIPTELSKLGLQYLDLSDNSFVGKIPSFYNHSSLQYLHLRKNNLRGSMPDMLSNFSRLITLDLGDNHLTGNIPRWLSKFQNLRVLQLGGNRLQGQVPLQLCELANIDILDISHNNLFGEIPACFGNMSFGNWNRLFTSNSSDVTFDYVPEEVKVIVKNNYLTYTEDNILSMSALDLSCNKLTGLIPPELGVLEYIHSLNFSHNYLSGPIPISFSNLKQIEGLDLSFNNLSGSIPSQLVELNSLEIFNVSYNTLTGRVPVSGQFGSFDEKNYLGNPGLFGFPGSDLHNQTQSLPPSSHNKDRGDGDNDGTFVEDFLWSFGMSCATIFLATIAILHINPHWRKACFDFVDWYILWWLPMSWRSMY